MTTGDVTRAARVSGSYVSCQEDLLLIIMTQADEDEPYTGNGPHVYTQPTIYRWSDVKAGVWDGRRVFDKSDVLQNITEGQPLIVKGGTHLTGTTLLPNTILKVHFSL